MQDKQIGHPPPSATYFKENSEPYLRWPMSVTAKHHRNNRAKLSRPKFLKKLQNITIISADITARTFANAKAKALENDRAKSFAKPRQNFLQTSQHNFLQTSRQKFLQTLQQIIFQTLG